MEKKIESDEFYSIDKKSDLDHIFVEMEQKNNENAQNQRMNRSLSVQNPQDNVNRQTKTNQSFQLGKNILHNMNGVDTQQSQSYSQVSISQSNNKMELQRQQSKKKEEKSTVMQASINLFKSYIGAGILGLPYAFFNAGYFLGGVCLMIVCGLVIYSSTLIFDIQDSFEDKQMDFKEMFNRTMGRRATQCYQFFLIVAQIGCCVSYVIFFTEFFMIAFKTEKDPSSRYLYLLLSSFIIMPLIMINNFHFFVKWSKIANILTIMVLLGIMEFALETVITEPNAENEHNYAHFLNLAGFLGIAIYSFEAIGTMFYVRQSMKEPEKFPKIFMIISIVVASIAVIFSTLCSLAMGKELKQIVLLGLEKKRSYFLLLSAFYAVNMIFSYPVQFYPIIDVLNKLKIDKKYQFVPRLACTGFIFFFAFAIPKFGVMINLIGAFAGVALQFYFPILAYHKHFGPRVKKSTWCVNITVLIVTTMCGIFSIQHSIKEIYEHHN